MGSAAGGYGRRLRTAELVAGGVDGCLQGEVSAPCPFTRQARSHEEDAFAASWGRVCLRASRGLKLRTIVPIFPILQTNVLLLCYTVGEQKEPVQALFRLLRFCNTAAHRWRQCSLSPVPRLQDPLRPGTQGSEVSCHVRARVCPSCRRSFPTPHVSCLQS